MKKFLPVFVIILLLSACMPQLETVYRFNKESNLYGVDFRQYSEEGFFMSTEMYKGSYEPIGSLSYELYPAADYVVVDNVASHDNDKGQTVYKPIYMWSPQTILIQEAVDSLYLRCKTMEADALVNFDVDLVEKSHEGIANPVTLKGVRVSGFAIKRN